MIFLFFAAVFYVKGGDIENVIKEILKHCRPSIHDWCLRQIHLLIKIDSPRRNSRNCMASRCLFYLLQKVAPRIISVRGEDSSMGRVADVVQHFDEVTHVFEQPFVRFQLVVDRNREHVLGCLWGRRIRCVRYNF